MVIIGITGGIGAGKSLVLDIMKEEFGCYTLEADKLAHRLMEPGEEAYDKIVEYFGEDILLEDKTIDRVKLGNIVMTSSEALDSLNSFVHPAVKRYIIKDIEDRAAEGTEVYVLEAALLLQQNYDTICDEIWYIHAPVNIRLQRLIETRNMDKERAVSFIANQPDETFYSERADRILDNSTDREGITKQVDDCLKECYNSAI